MTKSKVSIGLVNPKSPNNVKSVMRLAGNYQADSVFYTGKRYPNALERSNSSVDMRRKISQDIPLTEVPCLTDELSDDMTIVCVEFVENAISLPEFEHPEQALYIFGPEDGSIDKNIVAKADAVVFIPTNGCMNLAATVNVVLYDRLVKSKQYFDANDLIRNNRDVNNKLKI